MDIYAGDCCVIFGFGHQGAELLSAKGEKMGVLAIFGGFYVYKGPKYVVKDPKDHVKASWGVPGFMLKTFAHRR